MGRNLADDLLRFIKSVPAQQKSGLGELFTKRTAFFRLLSQTSLFLLGGHGALAGMPFLDEQIERQAKADHQSRGHATNRAKNGLVPPHQLLESVETARRTGEDRFIVQVTLNVHPQAVGGLVTARSEEHTSELQSQSNLVCRLLL